MIRVLVAASSAVVRAGLESILSREAGVVVVGGSGTLRSLASDAAEHEPDVVLLELTGEHPEELFTTLSLLSVDADDGARAAPRVVLLTDQPDSVRVGELLHAGVRALLSREAAPDEIVAAVQGAAAGLVALAAEWLDRVVPAGAAILRRAGNGSTRNTPLSTREVEVLRMVADGLANKQIAARLQISEHTVKFHVASILAKLHASTRAEAVRNGARSGLVVV
jgi:DNA-binding NarL/FixJ family response regulator